jgi:hypothetical protein
LNDAGSGTTLVAEVVITVFPQPRNALSRV